MVRSRTLIKYNNTMSMEKGSDIMILRGTAMWASVCDGKPNDLSKKYQVDICNLSNEDSDKLKEAGIAVKNGADKGNFVIAKGAYNWTFKTTAGTSLGLNELMVVSLISYNDVLEAEETDFDDEDEREVA